MTSVPTTPPPIPATSTDPALLVAFLASHAARCPYCSYSLQALAATACPECGGPLALGVVPPSYTTSTRRALDTPVLAMVPIGIVGALFATFVRDEHDDWIVGTSIATSALLLGGILFAFRASILLRRPLHTAALMSLWALVVLAAGLSFFLDI